MTVQLDARQRAMLAEMGVRVFVPAPDAPRAEPAAPATVRAAAPVVSQPASAPSERSAVVRDASVAGLDLDLDWDALTQAVASCQACGLCQGRRQAVLGAGDRRADWLVVGEAPGELEDVQGTPFVGPAGKLLDNMLRAMGLARDQNVYLTNVLKCRPPGNRNPDSTERAQCEPFLRRQVMLLQPRIIVAMGRFAVQSLLGSDEPIGKLRGQVHRYQGVPVVVTYHPDYLLRNLPDKAKAWADLCLALDQLAVAS